MFMFLSCLVKDRLLFRVLRVFGNMADKLRISIDTCMSRRHIHPRNLSPKSPSKKLETTLTIHSRYANPIHTASSFECQARKAPPADLLDDPLLALMSSSARHSAIVLMFLNAASRAPVVSSISA